MSWICKLKDAVSANYGDDPCFPNSDTLTDTWDKHRGG